MIGSTSFFNILKVGISEVDMATCVAWWTVCHNQERYKNYSRSLSGFFTSQYMKVPLSQVSKNGRPDTEGGWPVDNIEHILLDTFTTLCLYLQLCIYSWTNLQMCLQDIDRSNNAR
jgi:hypothetical protein